MIELIATSLAEILRGRRDFPQLVHPEVLNSICSSITETLFQFWLKTIY